MPGQSFEDVSVALGYPCLLGRVYHREFELHACAEAVALELCCLGVLTVLVCTHTLNAQAHREVERFDKVLNRRGGVALRRGHVHRPPFRVPVGDVAHVPAIASAEEEQEEPGDVVVGGLQARLLLKPKVQTSLGENLQSCDADVPQPSVPHVRMVGVVHGYPQFCPAWASRVMIKL